MGDGRRSEKDRSPPRPLAYPCVSLLLLSNAARSKSCRLSSLQLIEAVMPLRGAKGRVVTRSFHCEE